MRTVAKSIYGGREQIKGQIVKAVSGMYTVVTEDGIRLECPVRGKLKRDVDLYVGDYVIIDDGVVSEILPRKNVLIRPYVANIDTLCIVVSPVPQPDWICVEKLLLNCSHEKIDCSVIYNKCDLIDEKTARAFLKPYKNDAATFIVSAREGRNMESLKDFLKGKLVCFAGQSAVGKSSLINALGKTDLEVGEMSVRILRGKNTTRQVEIFDFGDMRVVDTCGFSVMESIDIRHDELIYYYDDFLAFQSECKYTNCTHTKEPSCAVKAAVENGKLSADRYARYVRLFDILKENRRNRYD